MPIILIVIIFILSSVAHSQDTTSYTKGLTHPLYIGVSGGFGNTTWDGLVPSESNQSTAMKTSVPIIVREGGGVWGFFAGYELTPFFAIEANYMHYPAATLVFDEYSIFAYDHDDIREFRTYTQTGSIIAKIMINVPRTAVRFYSSFGAAKVYRKDCLNATKLDSPLFGIGFILNVTEHVMAEIGGNYIAGWGESEINPSMHYVPFSYAGFFKLAYRI